MIMTKTQHPHDFDRDICEAEKEASKAYLEVKRYCANRASKEYRDAFDRQVKAISRASEARRKRAELELANTCSAHRLPIQTAKDLNTKVIHGKN